ncbi:hypothetical protein [Streptomyces sp. NPDC086766]|uniref:hypothetical protein n=1 Tax=Streptomyces sp. NPDC086766 TaxID=3365754 RepID=UPI0038200AFC
MTTSPKPFAPIPLYNISLSHVRLPSTQLHIDRLSKRSTKLALGTDVVLVALSTSAGPAPDEPADTDRSRLTWPAWKASTVPSTHQEWKAVFFTRDRTFRGLYYEAPDAGSSQILHAAPAVLPDPMWQMLQNTSCAVLCTGLVGDPSAADIRTALLQGKLQALLVEALFG